MSVTYATTEDVANLERIGKALNGDRLGQRLIAKVGLRLLIKLLCKNTDYGDSAFKEGRLSASPASLGILIRMDDKIERLQQLGKGNPSEVRESFADTIDDLAGYCILWQANRDFQLYRGQ